jgi:uncharacterized protein
MTAIPSRSSATPPASATRQAAASTGAWNPYIVGAAMGVLSWLVFAIVDKPLGISTSLSAASGWCAAAVIGADKVAGNPYWAKHGPKLDYGMVFVVGTFLGALASSIASKSFRAEVVPEVWRERFGSSALKRFLAAFLGGILILYGARMAGGCTSGHGISGSLQLALSSWTFFLTMFASGIVTALLLFRRRAA